MEVRKATLNDVGAILILGWRLHRESNYSDLAFDDDKAIKAITDAISNDTCLALVATHNDKIIGYFFAFKTDWYFTHEQVACELGLYVVEDYRGTRAAYLLVKGFVEWAERQGVKQIRAGNSVGITVEPTARLYEHFGFERCGLSLIKRINE